MLEPKQMSAKFAHEFKASQVKIRLDQIIVADKIELHKRTTEIIFSDLLHSTIGNAKI